jgi:hypothetical protein
MRTIIIAGVLVAGTLAGSAFAAAQNAMTAEKFCAETRLSEADQAACKADLRAATTDEARAKVMQNYQNRLDASPPLRNDLSSNEAGVRRATPPSGSSAGTAATGSGTSATTGTVVEPTPPN